MSTFITLNSVGARSRADVPHWKIGIKYLETLSGLRTVAELIELIANCFPNAEKWIALAERCSLVRRWSQCVQLPKQSYKVGASVYQFAVAPSVNGFVTIAYRVTKVASIVLGCVTSCGEQIFVLGDRVRVIIGHVDAVGDAWTAVYALVKHFRASWMRVASAVNDVIISILVLAAPCLFVSPAVYLALGVVGIALDICMHFRDARDE